MKMPKGDYYHQKFGGKNLKTFDVRQLFWDILTNRAPKTLKYLKENVLPIYNQLFPEDYSSTCGTLNLERLHWNKIEAVNTVCKNHLAPLITIINKWSEEFNLVDDWIKDKVLLTLADWRKFPPREREKLSYFGVDSITFLKQSRFFSFKTNGWDLSLETWGDTKKRITLDFKNSLDQYKKETEDIAKKSGLVKTRTKRKIDKHIRWLIDYQVYKKSTIDLVNSESRKRLESIDPNTISRMIQRTADLLGLTLRKNIHFKK